MCIAEINLRGNGARERLIHSWKRWHLLFVPETEAFNRVSLREPTHANVLVPIRGNDVRLIGSEDE